MSVKALRGMEFGSVQPITGALLFQSLGFGLIT